MKRAPLSYPQYQQDQKDYHQDGYHRVQCPAPHAPFPPLLHFTPRGFYPHAESGKRAGLTEDKGRTLPLDPAPRGMLAKRAGGATVTSGPSTGCYQQSKERSGSETVWEDGPLPVRVREPRKDIVQCRAPFPTT